MTEYDICVIGGAGHIGLPLSIAFAERGLRVVINDINEKSLQTIKNGHMPFIEQGAENLLKKVINKTLFTSSLPEVIEKSKFIIVTIGTPVDEHLNPEYNTMRSFFKEMIPYLKNFHIIILRSTVYPGTTKKVRSLLQEVYPDIEICFCCERILEGKAMEELFTLPQIIAGFEENAVNEVSDLFKKLTDKIVITEPLEAELTKLFTNSWRYIQFATANQFYMIAEEFGADFYKIYDTMTYKYPRAEGFPRAGFAAGPCLFKDTMQLSAYAKNKFFLGHSAMLINEGLPDFVFDMLKRKCNLEKKTIGILGMAFKAESDDNRESLSYKLKKLAEMEAKAVLCSDVYIQDPNFIDENELIKKCDIILIGAPHARYKSLDYMNKEIIDVWNFVKSKQ